MEFNNEERIYYNRNMFEEHNLHVQLSRELFLQYFVTLMRDYGIETQYTSQNYTIRENIKEGSYIITNNKTGMKYYNKEEVIFSANPFHLIKGKYLQNCSSSLNEVIKLINEQNTQNYASMKAEQIYNESEESQ